MDKYVGNGSYAPKIRLYVGADKFVSGVSRLLRWAFEHKLIPFNYSLTNPYSKYFKALGLYVGLCHCGVEVAFYENDRLLLELRILEWANEYTELVMVEYIKLEQ